MAVLDQRLHLAARQQQSAEQVGRETRLMKNLLDRQRAAGDVAGVLEQCGVAGHQRRRGETERLPEGEIPWHHRQQDADRVEGDERFRPADVHRLPGEIFLRALGEPVALDGALLDFGAAVGQCLAHLLGHQRRKIVAPPAQHRARFAHQRGAIRKGHLPPIQERRARSGGGGAGVVDRVRRIAAAGLTGRGVDGLDHRPVRSQRRDDLIGLKLIAQQTAPLIGRALSHEQTAVDPVPGRLHFE